MKNLKLYIESEIESINLNDSRAYLKDLLDNLDYKIDWSIENSLYNKERKRLRKIIAFLNSKNRSDYTKQEYYFFAYLLTSSFTLINRNNEIKRIIKIIKE